MSQTTSDDLDPWNGLYYTVSEGLIPLFKGQGRGSTYAKYAAGEAISGYHPESRADYATIGRILALSLSTITAATLAADPEVPVTEKIKFLGKVHTLSQAADRAEKVMMTRRTWQKTEATRPDTLVPRPHNRPSRYPPLPPSDPASGAYRGHATKIVASPAPAAEAPAPAATDQTGPPQPAPPKAETAIQATQPAEKPEALPTRPDSTTPEQGTESPHADDSFPARLMASMQEALRARGIPFDPELLRADFGLPPITASKPDDKAAAHGQRPRTGGNAPVKTS